MSRVWHGVAATSACKFYNQPTGVLAYRHIAPAASFVSPTRAEQVPENVVRTAVPAPVGQGRADWASDQQPPRLIPLPASLYPLGKRTGPVCCPENSPLEQHVNNEIAGATQSLSCESCVCLGRQLVTSASRAKIYYAVPPLEGRLCNMIICGQLYPRTIYRFPGLEPLVEHLDHWIGYIRMGNLPFQLLPQIMGGPTRPSAHIAEDSGPERITERGDLLISHISYAVSIPCPAWMYLPMSQVCLVSDGLFDFPAPAIQETLAGVHATACLL